MEKFKKKQKNLDNSKIQIRFCTGIQIKSLSDIIYALWFNNTNRQTERYHKGFKEFRKQFTGELRSIEDFYLIVKYYFENSITYEQCYNAIVLMYNEGYMDHNFCPTVRRRVNWCSKFPRPSSYTINKILTTKKLDFKL